VRGLTQRQQSLLTTLVTHYQKKVYSIALRITKDPVLAGEAFQDTFVRVARWIKVKRGAADITADTVGGLVQVCAERAATDVLRKRIRENRFEQAETGQAATISPDLTVQIDVDRLLPLLESREREVLELHYLGGYSSPEIGKLLGVKAGAIRTIKHRALHKLRRAISPDTKKNRQ
jgi:RNA polymerase sigma factor (sigma-70 family)